MMKTLAISLLIGLCSTPALAQTGPSFDCAKAASPIEKAICGDAGLAKADREMATAYAELQMRLDPPARQDLAADQEYWIVGRNRDCPGSALGLKPCIADAYNDRTAQLKMFAVGNFPFIATKNLSAHGTLGKIKWSYDISYPRFDSETVDYHRLNDDIAAEMKKTSDEARPTNDADPDREQEWTYEGVFNFERVGERALMLSLGYNGFAGGAHPFANARCMLIDLRTGLPVPPDGVFAPGNRWLDVLVPLVTADLKHQFEEKPGFDEVLQPDKMTKLLRDQNYYCWATDSLDLEFNAYDVGPYVSGPFEVKIPMATVKPLLRADGPLGDLR
jgi:uncharacterized protein